MFSDKISAFPSSLFNMQATLIINGEKRVGVQDGVTSIGRAPENSISIPEDPNISRFHIEIETFGDEFRLIELGSSNGTTVNNQRVENSVVLKNGDKIILGGTTKLEFQLEKESPAADEEKIPSADAGVVAPPDVALELPSANIAAAVPPLSEPSRSKFPIILAIAAIAGGLALVFVVAAILLSVNWAQKCEAKIAFTSPDNGELISKPTEVAIEAQNEKCVKRAIFLLDGEEFASANEAPYVASLDPRAFPEYADGNNHVLKVALEDDKGKRTVQPAEVIVAIETLATPTPTPEETSDAASATASTQTKTSATQRQISLIDLQEMSRRVVKQFSGNFSYKFDQQFLQEVQKRAPEYAVEGYFARAAEFRDLINVEFHKENALDPPLGFLLAMSRSKFSPQKTGAEEGLWKLTDEFVSTNGYKVACAESLSDPKQICAAKTAAIYTKALSLKIFEGNIIYAVAAFGMTEGEAVSWKNSLPPNREDFWKLISSIKQREQLTRFFAAAIVAENPQKFGLKKDRPISELYKNLM